MQVALRRIPHISIQSKMHITQDAHNCTQLSYIGLKAISFSIAAVQINFISRLVPVTGKDGLDNLVCSKHMGLHSSVGRALHRRGHWLEHR